MSIYNSITVNDTFPFNDQLARGIYILKGKGAAIIIFELYLYIGNAFFGNGTVWSGVTQRGY